MSQLDFHCAAAVPKPTRPLLTGGRRATWMSLSRNFDTFCELPRLLVAS